MSYLFHCTTPHDRLVYLDERSKAVKPFLDEVPSEERMMTRIVVNEGGDESSQVVTYDEIATEYAFQHTSRLVFAQESDLRNMPFWGFDADVFPPAESHSCASELLKGSICDSIAIKFISRGMGAGLFALSRIKAHSFIGEYCGIVGHGSRSGDKPSAYALNYPSGDSHEIDSQHIGSMMRFCNHSSKPNCVFKSVWLDCVHVVVLVGDQDIEAGAQLTVDYGQGYWHGQGGAPEPI